MLQARKTPRFAEPPRVFGRPAAFSRPLHAAYPDPITKTMGHFLSVFWLALLDQDYNPIPEGFPVKQVSPPWAAGIAFYHN